PAYGRDWPAGGVGGGRALTARQIDELTARRGITPAYDAATGEATFNYIDDQGVARVVWFTPPEGVAAKLSLVDEYGLGGFVMWRMGQEVDGYWTAITRALP
ncbi:MAG TPA: chitinase, partial [Bacillota bacterium]